MIKEREYCMSVDNFKKPTVYKNQPAIALLLTRLILLNPGSDPLHPDMGVGITNYRYAYGRLDELKARVRDQINTYLKCFTSAQVDITIDNNKMCNIEITIDDTMYIYDSSEAPIPITIESAK